MKHLFYSILIVSLCLLFGCASEAEQEAFDKIEAYYKADVSWAKGFNTVAGEQTQKYISIDVKNSQAVNNIGHKIVAPHVAVLLFENTPAEDMEKYTHVKVNIFEQSDDGAEATHSATFPLEVIKKAAEQKSQVTQATLNLIAKSPDSLYDMLRDEFRNEEQQVKFTNYFNQMLEERGSITKTNVVGIDAKVDTKTNERLLEYTALVNWGNLEDPSLFRATVYEEPSKQGLFSFHLQ